MTLTAADLAQTLEDALKRPSLCGAFQLTAAAYGDRPALTTPDGSVTISWTRYAERVRAVAGGLASLGVRAGDCVALLLSNRPEFHIVDTGAMHLGATPFSIYHTNPAEQIAPLLANSGARVMITEQLFLERALQARALHPALEHIVVVDAVRDDLLTLEDLEARATEAFDFETAWRSVGPDDIGTLVYTSGTTGEPKGVQHTHGSLLVSVQSFHDYIPFSPEGRVVSYLPMAHIAERVISHYSAMVTGLCITCCADPKQLPLALANTRPTRLFGVPRIYDKLRGAILAMAAGDPEGPLAQAIQAGLLRVRAMQAGEPAPALSAEHEAVLAAVRAKTGLDRAEMVGVAAAPSSPSMLEFFPAIGVDLLEFWGMSECIFSTANPVDRPKYGTIGLAAPGVEIRLADDGEILVRGPNLMAGYRGEPAKTAEAIDADGWLHSGDIAVADADGYLKIVDRKKELIINSAGKNMAPSKIEMAIKDAGPLIAQVVAIGDARPFVTALVVLDEEACQRHAQAHGLTGDFASIATDPGVRAQVAAAVAAGNERLARVEQVKYHAVITTPWAPGGDELTPTMKLRRRPISAKYAAEIDAMYDGVE
jgi:long-chain acyl-CoA synthetase